MASSFPFIRVNAFASATAQGNPCVVVFDADAMTPAEKGAIAKQINLSETVFVGEARDKDCGFRLTFMTPVQEIPLAGHPTLAAAAALLEAGRIAPAITRLPFELAAGKIEVIIEAQKPFPNFAMTQIPPRFGRRYAPEDVLPLFGLAAGDLLNILPIQTVDTGTPILIIPVRDKRALEKIRLHLDAFAAFTAQGDFFCAHIFCLEGFTDQADVAARDFAPPPDVIEDPFTGSATGAMGCYIAHYGLSPKNRLIVEQGHFMGQPGLGFVETRRIGQTIESVIVGGGTQIAAKGFLEKAGDTWKLLQTPSLH